MPVAPITCRLSSALKNRHRIVGAILLLCISSAYAMRRSFGITDLWHEQETAVNGIYKQANAGSQSICTVLSGASVTTVAISTVTTDLVDYQPGGTAVIYANGFQAGETLQFLVLHTDGTPNTGGGHEPWMVTDGEAGDLDGTTDGNITTTYYLNPDDSFDSSFQLTATGLSSGSEASCTFTSPWSNPRVFVDHEKTDGGLSGINWANALLTIEEALEIAAGSLYVEEIWVAEGTYKLPTASARGESYELVSNVKLMGGFNGTLQNMSDRLPFTTTVMSGDIGEAADSSDNCYHVISVPIGVTGAVVDGMTITGGNANGDSPDNTGGGIFNEGDLSVIDCIIIGCTSTEPGQAAHNKSTGEITMKGSTMLQN